MLQESVRDVFQVFQDVSSRFSRFYRDFRNLHRLSHELHGDPRGFQRRFMRFQGFSKGVSGPSQALREFQGVLEKIQGVSGRFTGFQVSLMGV